MRIGAAPFLALAFACAARLQAQAQPHPQPGLDVSGVIVSGANGEALARVRVDGPGDERIYPDVLTDDLGRFTLRVPAEASTRLRLSKAGFAVKATTFPARDAAKPLRLEMERGAAISGRIIATAGTPMRARIFVHPETPGSTEPIAVLTDDRGEFRVGALPQGRYVVTATRGSIWTARVTPDGERHWILYDPIGVMVPPLPPDGSQRLVVARAGEETIGTDFTFEIIPPQFGGGSLPIALQDQALPPGSVRGTVVDERGEPMQGVAIRAQYLRTVNGRTVALSATDPVKTDDRGHFRVFSLRPGEYVVTALVDAQLGRGREYPITYGGGTFDLESATRWQVGESEEGGVGIVMVPADLFSVGGTVLSSSGVPVSGSVRLTLTHRSGRPIPEPRSAPLGPEGSFSFAGLSAGEYVVQANTGGTFGTPEEFGVAFVTVGDGPPALLLVRTVAPSTLSGRVIVEGGAGEPPLGGLTLRVLPVDPDRAPANQSGTASLTTVSDGTFSIARLAGRNRIVLGGAADGWFMKELLVGGSDVAEDPFDFGEGGASFDDAVLVMSPRGAIITGQAAPDSDGPLPAYWAVAFPTGTGDRISRSQFIKYARASADGTFRLTSLPPGSYYVAAVPTLTPPVGVDEWQPADLDRLAALATRVTIAEGQTHTVRPRLALR